MRGDVLSTWKARLREGLRTLQEQHLTRTLAEIQGVNLCSNDYLGLAEHRGLREAVAQAVLNGPRIGGTGSRLLSGQTEEWRKLEEEFARFAGTESSLFFSSGYAANIGLLAALVGKDDVVYSDVLNHASLIDGMRLSGARKVIYPHLDLNALEDALQQDAGAPWRRLIVTESVFSMDGDIAPLKEMAALASKYGAAMIVDEAHATAVHGPLGRGLVAQAKILPQVLAVVHTCGKALGSAGAFVCGPAVLKEHLINHARTFVYSTALPPYFAEQITVAMRLAQGMNRSARNYAGGRSSCSARCGRKDLTPRGVRARLCLWFLARMKRHSTQRLICSAPGLLFGQSDGRRCLPGGHGYAFRLRSRFRKSN